MVDQCLVGSGNKDTNCLKVRCVVECGPLLVGLARKKLRYDEFQYLSLRVTKAICGFREGKRALVGWNEE